MRIFWTLSVVTLLAACTSAPEPIEEPSSSVTSGVTGTWTLLELAGRRALPGTTLTLQAGQVSGNGGCNGYDGAYTLQGTSLSITDTTHTDKECLEEGRMRQESDYFRLLSATRAATRAGDRLTLEAAGGALVFARAPSSAPDVLTLLGTWKLATIYDGKRPSAPVAGRVVTMTFSEDALEANLGCNLTSGAYQAQGAALTFSGLSMTRRACTGDEGEALMRQERELSQVLSGVTAHVFEGRTLTLLQGDVPVLRWTRVNP